MCVKRSQDNSEPNSSGVTQLLASFTGEPIFSRDRRLYVGNQQLSAQNALVAAVATPTENRQLLAVATLQKELIVYERENHEWHSLCTHILPKRVTAVAIDNTFIHVVVSDAVGDVYRLSLQESLDLKNDNVQDELRLLGHFSTVTDMSLSSRYIATADRDNKIRVSRYPLSYVIESFCLSHTQFITSLEWALVPNLLLSAAGDSTIRLWNGATGKQISCLQLSDSAVIQDALPNDMNPLVVKIAIHPLNKDIAFFVLHNTDAIFALSGLCDSKIKGVRLVSSFGRNRYVTGFSTCRKGFAYVSTQEEAHVMQAPLSSCDETAGLQLTFTALRHTIPAEVSDRTSLCEGDERKVLRFNWLARQGKKEMVHNWKGKKRRYADV